MKEPIAYAAFATDGSEAAYVASLKEQAEAACQDFGWSLAPLYAGHTEEERRAMQAAIEMMEEEPGMSAFRKTLQAMLNQGDGE